MGGIRQNRAGPQDGNKVEGLRPEQRSKQRQMMHQEGNRNTKPCDPPKAQDNSQVEGLPARAAERGTGA